MYLRRGEVPWPGKIPPGSVLITPSIRSPIVDYRWCSSPYLANRLIYPDRVDPLSFKPFNLHDLPFLCISIINGPALLYRLCISPIAAPGVKTAVRISVVPRALHVPDPCSRGGFGPPSAVSRGFLAKQVARRAGAG
jgi:hypothetical protein